MVISVSDSCIGCGTCEGIAPDVFEMNDDGVAVVKDGADASAPEVDEAISSCPVEAISK